MAPALPLLAGSGLDPMVHDIGFCFLLAGALSVVFARARVPDIAAFLAAGVLVGPQVGGVVTDQENIRTIANLGLVLLLFVIGLEIDLKQLAASGRTLLVTGALQFPLCVGLGVGLTLALQAAGWSGVSGGYLPLYVGFTVAASSTLLVAKLLQARFEMDTVVGRVGLGLLIFQDLWAIVVLAIQPNFAAPAIAPVAWTFLGIGMLVAAAYAIARWALPTALQWIAKLPELLLVAAVGWCFGIGFLGVNLPGLLGLLGLHWPVHVSLEMGALIAGATLASLPYAHDAKAKVGAVRDFFVTLFFVGLGMGIPRPDGAEVILLALVLAGGMLLARALVFFPLLYWTGLDRRNSFVTSTKLAQVSEFCLVIAYLGQGLGHLDGARVSAVIFAFVLTALATPALFGVGDALHDRLDGLLTRLGFRRPPPAVIGDAAHGHPLVLLGFHRVASSLLHEIERHRPELLAGTLVLDFNVSLHDAIRQRGAHAHYADVSNADALQHAGIDRAHVIVCTIPDDVLKGTTNLRLARELRRLNPAATIIVNAIRYPDVAAMRAAGATHVFLARAETAASVLPAVTAALDGGLAQWQAEHEERLGRLDERREVLP